MLFMKGFLVFWGVFLVSQVPQNKYQKRFKDVEGKPLRRKKNFYIVRGCCRQ